MQGPDSTELSTEGEQAEIGSKLPIFAPPSEQPKETQPADTGFDWLAMGVIILLAAVFAIAARFNTQPASSLTPAAVLSATGCGLLVTALRKIRTVQKPGLLEAALGGLSLTVAQFLAAISYPNVIHTLSTIQGVALGFFTTWGLVAAFSIIFSLAGTLLGHLAFAPLRPLPDKKQPAQPEREDLSPLEESEGQDELTDAEANDEDTWEDKGETGEEHSEDEHADVFSAQEEAVATGTAPTTRSFISYLVVVILMGFAPTMTGYVFSAAFDFMLNAYHFFAGPYPSLRLLSTLLPWQIPLQITLNPNNPNTSIFLIWELWRIPLFLGNPTMFDFQALEPLTFSSSALGLLLLTMHGRDDQAVTRPLPMNWITYLLLEAVLGLMLVLPADLVLLKGLLGLLQIDVLNFVVPLRPLHLLDPLTFTLNLVTGPALCITLGILIRRQHTLHQKTL